MAATIAKRQANRLPALLDAAAAHFAERGYHATTMRDIAQEAGVTPGAVYFHVPTKQALLLAVYAQGVDRIIGRFEKALEGQRDPNIRLRCAIMAHLEAILDASAYARVIVRVLPEDIPEATNELKLQRERYESRLRSLLAEVDLPAGRDPKLARLMLIGALNWTPVWYRKSAGSLDGIVNEYLASFGLSPTPLAGK
ncbi:TetR family transcriptional regulator [Bradyrhizobium manausense]|uniref:TetR/AcrR family transcriptional regulator n=1 Tax=Bradyrhizobium manausense TaxID=989370 RepID=UPI001BAC8932|nr:TetR family transcriptional regulator [Bradyrhizobium manausense]MBR1087670.1 TetR family transcriptional regulator [Bradyrhizobium manausense]